MSGLWLAKGDAFSIARKYHGRYEDELTFYSRDHLCGYWFYFIRIATEGVACFSKEMVWKKGGMDFTGGYCSVLGRQKPITRVKE